MGYKPVSYTHLDVYKRQVHCIGGENAAINPLVIENRLHELDKDLDLSLIHI